MRALAYLCTEDLSFSYAGVEGERHAALSDISFEAQRGSITVICGSSGSGKTTLLKLLKPVLAPAGDPSGSILLDGEPVSALGPRQQASRIGFVMQDPEAQICSDTVLAELAFGLENIGCPREEMRSRIAEVVLFFGLQKMLHERTADLSGGEKQLLNLASVIALRPELIILDEPMAQLDPIMRARFLEMIVRLNRELGMTVVMSEHQLDDLMPIADTVVVLDEGRCACSGAPAAVARSLDALGDPLDRLLPAPTRIFLKVEGDAGSRTDGRDDARRIPLSVREGREWLEAFMEGKSPDVRACERPERSVPVGDGAADDAVLQMSDVRFRYERSGVDVLNDCSLTLCSGSITALLGGNGSGKSTLLKVLAGKLSPYMGSIRLGGSRARVKALRASGSIAYLPQDATLLFTRDTVRDELASATVVADDITDALADARKRDPFELSAGQQQALALAMVLGADADIVLLDEPTKGMDLGLRSLIQRILEREAAAGTTFLIATHDIGFAAACADRCAMVLDGSIALHASTDEVLAQGFLYTTASRRMSAGIFADALTPEEVIACCQEAMRE